MRFLATTKTVAIAGKNVTFASAQLTDLRKQSLEKSARLIAQGTTLEPGEVMNVLSLIKSRLPQVLAEGNKLDLGFAYLVPTVSGSLKESDWRASRVAALMKANPTWTKAKATTEQNKEKFTASLLTSKMLTAGYSIRCDEEFAHGVNDSVEWERVKSGEPDEESSSAGGSTYTPDEDGLGS